ncbi:hypothetical protein BH18GEM1_BH18GEM1_08960 [soil metagenome]
MIQLAESFPTDRRSSICPPGRRARKYRVCSVPARGRRIATRTRPADGHVRRSTPEGIHRLETPIFKLLTSEGSKAGHVLLQSFDQVSTKRGAQLRPRNSPREGQEQKAFDMRKPAIGNTLQGHSNSGGSLESNAQICFPSLPLRPVQSPLIPPGRETRLDIKELEYTTQRGGSSIPQIRHSEHENPGRWIEWQELLQLPVIATARDIQVLTLSQGFFDRPRLCSPAVPENVMGDHPLDRVANHIDQFRIGHDAVHSRGHATRERKAGVPG